LRKEQEWEWKEEQQNTFDTLKVRFTTNLILCTADPETLLRVESDTSDYVMGAILSMKCKDDKWRPCTFYLNSLSNVERNYNVHDKEMLGIIRALEAWRHHLEGATHKVEVWCDHRNLQYFMGAKKLNQQQACWTLYLTRFDFEMIHKPGASIGKVDALSRRPDQKRE
jgi:RNase H-like domain found in reverse transcriptase